MIVPSPLDALLPPEMARRAEEVGAAKVAMDGGRLVALAVLAGTFIALGGIFSTVERRSLFVLSPWSNPFLFAATAAALLVHVAALYLSPTQFLLRVEPLDAGTWIRMTLVASTILIAVEAHKLLRRRRGAADKAARGHRAAGGRPNHA